mgnify:CR=1
MTETVPDQASLLVRKLFNWNRFLVVAEKQKEIVAARGTGLDTDNGGRHRRCSNI